MARIWYLPKRTYRPSGSRRRGGVQKYYDHGIVILGLQFADYFIDDFFWGLIHIHRDDIAVRKFQGVKLRLKQGFGHKMSYPIRNPLIEKFITAKQEDPANLVFG